MSLALCIPAYNAAEFLPGLLEDAARQTKPFDEIWVHDDASTDGTGALAERLGARVLRSDQNVGCSLGKHRLLEATACDLVHFHDADDGLMPDFVAVSLEAMSRKVDVLLVGYEYREHPDDTLLAIRTFDDAALQADPVAYTIREPINTICGVYRRQAVLEAGGYKVPQSQLYNEDQAFHCRLARHGLRFRGLSSVHLISRRVNGSMSEGARLACVSAQYEVLAQAAAESEPQHHSAISTRLWQISAVAASLKDWRVADRAALLASELAGQGPGEGHAAYRWLARRAPRVAIRLRERAIGWLGKRPVEERP
ncbi:MAG: glycosyltransferase family 2 protein [Pseudomonadota bacterium]